MNSCSASEKDVRLTCFAFKIVVLRIKNPPFSQQKIWRQNGGKNLVSRFSNAEKTEFLIKKNSSNSEELEELVREAGLEPARPEWTLEPESSESANSTTRAFAVFQLLGYITTDIPACQAEGAEKLRKTYRRIAGMTGRRRGVLKIMQIPAITAQRGI